MQARDIMTPNPSVVTRSDTIARAATLMRDRHVGMLPVIDDLSSRHLVGVLTDRDIVIRGVARESDVGRLVGDVMTTERLAVARVDALPEDIADLMKHRQLRRIPVLDERGRVVGIVSMADLSRRFRSRTAHVFRAEPAPTELASAR